MDPLAVIQQALLEGRTVFTKHFLDEMINDYLLYADISSIVLESESIVDKGVDDDGDPKYEVNGPTTDGRKAGVICVIKDSVVFITAYEVHN